MFLDHLSSQLRSGHGQGPVEMLGDRPRRNLRAFDQPDLELLSGEGGWCVVVWAPQAALFTVVGVGGRRAVAGVNIP